MKIKDLILDVSQLSFQCLNAHLLAELSYQSLNAHLLDASSYLRLNAHLLDSLSYQPALNAHHLAALSYLRLNDNLFNASMPTLLPRPNSLKTNKNFSFMIRNTWTLSPHSRVNPSLFALFLQGKPVRQ